MKREIIAAAMSALVPGMGQLYNHQWFKGGVLVLAVMIVSGVIRNRGIIVATGGLSILMSLTLISLVIFAAADAYKGAEKSS